MACTELLQWHFIKNAEHRLKLFDSFDRKNHCFVFSINKTITWINMWICLMGVVTIAHQWDLASYSPVVVVLSN